MICDNCPHNCDLGEDRTGICHARSARDGKIICDNYGYVTSLALDPIEKKPLKMFHPSALILSVGSYGCNMDCPWCQNDSISRGRVTCDKLTPAELIDIAIETKNRGNIGIAYTYNEPSVGYEFVRDCAMMATAKGLVNAVVSNGMLSRTRFDALLPYIDAYNIDLKTPDEKAYSSIGGDLDLILANIRSAHDFGRHIELTTLVVPRFNDTYEDIDHITSLVANIYPSIPLHITRFFPAGRMKEYEPTRLDLLYEFRERAKGRLQNVFLGNV